jgi:hypothetical protein
MEKCLIRYFIIAPAKEKLKAKGYKQYSYDSIWKDFGLLHDKMDTTDKQALAPLILTHFTLEVHEKGTYH